MPRKIAVLSTGRQDWGILRSTCKLLQDDDSFELLLLLGGMHCSSQFGLTKQHIRNEGFTHIVELAWISNDTIPPANEQASAALEMVGGALAKLEPEALILVGDRFETVSAAFAATLNTIPIVHLHGGEETEGAFDNAFRHAITKLSHLHLVAHEDYAKRVLAMGEDAASVHIVGAPGLDNLNRRDLLTREALEQDLNMQLRAPVVVVTLHPSTLAATDVDEAAVLAAAMEEIEATYIITLPNTDPGHDSVRKVMQQAGNNRGRRAVEALGELRYWSLLKIADAIVGNSSSAMIEAPAIGLPAVNIGDRQKGRIRAGSVIDCKVDMPAIVAALRKALSSPFREEARLVKSPFGDGHSGEKIVEILRQWRPPKPPIKRFCFND